MQVDLRYRNMSFELAQSMFIVPFFDDDSRRLLLRVPPNEEILLETPKGAPILPGAVEGVLPAGTHVTVSKVSFWGGWTQLTRPIVTPRDRPWVEMTVAGHPAQPAFVLVLPPNLASSDAFFEKAAALLTDKPVDQEVASLPAADQEAVRTKKLVPGISARGLELAFGPPLRKDIHGDDTTRLEDWTWRSETMVRTAHLKDGVVASVDVHAPEAAAARP